MGSGITEINKDTFWQLIEETKRLRSLRKTARQEITLQALYMGSTVTKTAQS